MADAEDSVTAGPVEVFPAGLPAEHFAVIVHASKAHPGVNIEVDAPEGLRLTVHVNEWQAVDATIGEWGNAGQPNGPSHAANDVLATVLSELDQAAVNGDAEAPEDYAADVVTRLLRAYPAIGRGARDAAEDAIQADWAAARRYEIRGRAGGVLYLTDDPRQARVMLRQTPAACDVLDRATNEVIAWRDPEEVSGG